MHLKQALIATAFGAAVIASPLDVQPRSVPQKADHYSVINLDDFDLQANNGTLDKRQWRWCVDNGAQGKPNEQFHEGKDPPATRSLLTLRALAAICVNTGAAIINTIVAIANGIKAHSNAKDCSYHDGAVDQAQYQLHATGSHFDTTAEQDTIEGGLKTYFDSHGGAVCGVHCVQQNHGGTYKGYLKIAPQGIDISQVVCDDTVVFDDGCGSGGEKDAP